MDYDPVQLILEFRSIFERVLPDGIDTDEKVTGNPVTFGIIESDDVSEIVMLEKTLVYIKNIIVRTEDDRHIAESVHFAFSHEI